MRLFQILFFTAVVLTLVQLFSCIEQNDNDNNEKNESAEKTTGSDSKPDENANSDENDDNKEQEEGGDDLANNSNDVEKDDEDDSGNQQHVTTSDNTDEDNDEQTTTTDRNKYEDDKTENENEDENSKDDDQEENDYESFNSGEKSCKSVDFKSDEYKLCSNDWELLFYYDSKEKNPWERCKNFWYGGCKEISHLALNTEHECYETCAKDVDMDCTFYHGPKYCFGEYAPEKWTLFYTFDPVENKCVQRWYGNCSTFNYYTTMEDCEKKCGSRN